MHRRPHRLIQSGRLLQETAAWPVTLSIARAAGVPWRVAAWISHFAQFLDSAGLDPYSMKLTT